VLGKLVAAQTLWLAAFAVAVPYIWVLGRGVSLVGPALLVALVTGTLLAVALAAVGLLISGVAGSNRVSLATSFLLLLALFAPSQLPTTPPSWLSELLVRINPVHSTLRYIDALLVKAHPWTSDLSYLVSPLLTAVLAGAVLLVAAPRLVQLTGGVSAQ
jgi:ABC-2 type transport system permease protein